MKRTRMAAAVAAATVVSTVASLGIWTASSASADDTAGSGFQTFSLVAVAGGQRIIADGIASQGPGTVDSGIPDAEAAMTASTGHALASVAWPTALAGNAGSLLFLLGPNPCTPSEYQNPLPPVQSTCSPVATPDQVMNQYHYLNSPVRAEALRGLKPADDNSVPGATMSARAEDARTSAEAVLGAAYSTDIESFTSAHATSIVKLTGVSAAVADAASTLTGLELAGGEITIGSITSTAHSETDGTVAKGSGATTVHDMKIHGIPVTVDDKGVHVNGQTAGVVAPAASVVNQVLAGFGITMFVTKPTQDHKGGTANFSAGSLIIDWLPPGAPGGMTFEFGGTHVTAAARLPLTFDEEAVADGSSFVDNSISDVGPTVGGLSTFAPDFTGSAVAPTATNIRPRRRVVAPLRTELASTAKLPHGMSPWWPVLGLIAALGLALGLRRLPDRVLAAAGTTCGGDR